MNPDQEKIPETAAPPGEVTSSESSFSEKGLSKRRFHVILGVGILGTLVLALMFSVLLDSGKNEANAPRSDGPVKADMSRTASAMVDPELERQRRESEKGKAQDSAAQKAGNPAQPANVAVVGPPNPAAAGSTLQPGVTAQPGPPRPDQLQADAANLPAVFRDAQTPDGTRANRPGTPAVPAGTRDMEAETLSQVLAKAPLDAIVLDSSSPLSLSRITEDINSLPTDENPVEAIAAAARRMSQTNPSGAGTPAQNPNATIQQALSALGQQGRPYLQQRADANNSFVANAATPAQRPVLVSPRLSPYQLSEGSILTGVLLTEINSDLPGVIQAQVTEDVYDSINATTLVIPKGTRLIGKYSSAVDNGQNRILVAFTRMIFPNGASAELGGMSGTDSAGSAGFKDQVDNHFLRQFGASFLIASIARRFAKDDTVSSSVGATGAVSQTSVVGQVLNTTVSRILDRYTTVSPTIIIRKGYRFSIVTNRDMVLDPKMTRVAAR